MPTSTNVLNLKINELTEAQYDTAVQGGVIGANELSVLTDTDYTTKTTATGTLVVADWSNNSQTITVNGVTASNTVFVSPAPASSTEYASKGIICTSQGTDSLTFSCDTVPDNALTVNIVILN